MNTQTRKNCLTCFTGILIVSAGALYTASPVSAAAETALTSVNAIIDAGKTYAPIHNIQPQIPQTHGCGHRLRGLAAVDK